MARARTMARVIATGMARTMARMRVPGPLFALAQAMHIW